MSFCSFWAQEQNRWYIVTQKPQLHDVRLRLLYMPFYIIYQTVITLG